MSWPFTDPNTVPVRPAESPRTKPTLDYPSPSPMLVPTLHADPHEDQLHALDDTAAHERRSAPRAYKQAQHRRGESDVKAAYGGMPGAARLHAYAREGSQGEAAPEVFEAPPVPSASTPDDLLLQLSRYAFEDLPAFIDLTIANVGQDIFTRWPGQVNYAVTLDNAARRFSTAIRRRVGKTRPQDRPPYPAKTLLIQVERLVMLDTHATDDQDDWDCLREALRFMLVVSEAQSCAVQAFVRGAQEPKNGAHSDTARSPRRRSLDARTLLGTLIPSSSTAPTPPTPTKRLLRALGRDKTAASGPSSGGHEQGSNEENVSQSGCSDSAVSGQGSPTAYFNMTLASQRGAADAPHRTNGTAKENGSERSESFSPRSNALGIEQDAGQPPMEGRTSPAPEPPATRSRDKSAHRVSRRGYVIPSESEDDIQDDYDQRTLAQPARSTSPDRTPIARNEERSTFANGAASDDIGQWADLTRPSMDTIMRPSGRCSPAVASSDGNSPQISFTNRRLSNGSGSDVYPAAAQRPPSIAEVTSESDVEVLASVEDAREARKAGRHQVGPSAPKDSFLSAAEDSEIDVDDAAAAGAVAPRRTIVREAASSQVNSAQKLGSNGEESKRGQGVNAGRKKHAAKSASQSPFIMTSSTSSESSSDDEFADTEEQLDGFPEPPKTTSTGQGQPTLSPIITSPTPQSFSAMNASPRATSPQAVSPHTFSPQAVSNRSSRSSTGSGSVVSHRPRQALPPRAPEPRSPLPEPPAVGSNRLQQPAYRSRQRSSAGSFDSRSAQSHDSMGHALGYSNSESSSRRDGPPSFGHDSPTTTQDGSSLYGDEYPKAAAFAQKATAAAPAPPSAQAEPGWQDTMRRDSGRPSPSQLRASNKAVGLGFSVEEREYESRLAPYLANGWPQPGTVLPAPTESFQARVSSPQARLSTREHAASQSPQISPADAPHHVDPPTRELSSPMDQRRGVPLQLQEVQEESETEETQQSDAESEAPQPPEPSEPEPEPEPEPHFDHTEIKSRRAPSLRSEIERSSSVASSRRHQRSDSISSKNSDFPSSSSRSRFNPTLSLTRTGSRPSEITSATSTSGKTRSSHSGTSSMDRKEIDLAALGVGSPPIAGKPKYKKGSRSRILGHTSSLQNLNKSYRIQEEGLHGVMPGGFAPARPTLSGVASHDAAQAHSSGSKSGHKRSKEPARSSSSAASGSHHGSGRSRTDSGASSPQYPLVKHPTSFLVRSESLQAHVRQHSDGAAGGATLPRAHKSAKRKDSLLGMVWRGPDADDETELEEPDQDGQSGHKPRRKHKEGGADARSSAGHGRGMTKRGQVLDMSLSDSEEEGQDGEAEEAAVARRRRAEEEATPAYPGQRERVKSKASSGTASPVPGATSASRMLRFSKR